MSKKHKPGPIEQTLESVSNVHVIAAKAMIADGNSFDVTIGSCWATAFTLAILVADLHPEMVKVIAKNAREGILAAGGKEIGRASLNTLEGNAHRIVQRMLGK